MGCVSIHLRGGGQAREYIPKRLSAPNRGWHSQWFYLKNVASPALPGLALLEFSDSMIEATSERWMWGVPKREVKRIKDHLVVI
jgi:hypothetical protein